LVIAHDARFAAFLGDVSCNPASGDCMVVFGRSTTAGGGEQIHGRIITSAGVQSANDLVISASSTGLSPTVAWSGTRWVVAWRDTRNLAGETVFVASLNAAGTIVTAPYQLFLSAGQPVNQPAIACSDSGCFLLWDDFANGSSWEIRGG